MLFILIFIYCFIAFIEIVPLYKKKQKKESLACMLLISVALVLSLLIQAGVSLPSASKIIEKIVKFILGK